MNTSSEQDYRYAIREIIHPVTGIPPKVENYQEKLIYIDMRTRDTSYGKPWFSWLRDIRLFHTVAGKPVTLRHFDCVIDDVRSGSKIRLDISCNVEILLGSEYKAVTFLYRENDPDEAFRQHLVNWIRQFAGGREFSMATYFGLEEELKRTVTQHAEKNGFRIDIFFSPFSVGNSGREIELIRHVVSCAIKDSEISVICTVVMSLWDQLRFRQSKITDPKEWMKERIERITQGVLIDKSVLELLQGFPSREIMQRLEAETYEIGFRIRQIISIPQIEALELQKGFLFDTEPDHDSNDENSYQTKYITKDIRVPVRMNITVKGRIEKFEGYIERYLKPNVNLIEKMKEEVIDTARFFVRTVSPDRFYLHFSSAYEGQPSFEDELVRKISDMLQSHFNVIAPVILISRLNTDLIHRFWQISGREGEFICRSISEKINYRYSFRVIGVDPGGWFTFKSRIYDDPGTEDRPDLEEKQKQATARRKAESEILSIASSARKHIELFLNTHTLPDVQPLRDTPVPQLLLDLFNEAKKLIVRSHGLQIEIVNLERLPTDDDGDYNDELKERVKPVTGPMNGTNIDHALQKTGKPIIPVLSGNLLIGFNTDEAPSPDNA